MGILTTHKCPTCGCELTLDCGEIITKDLHGVDQLDLTLTCWNDCGEPVLNCFVPLSDFIPIEEG
jgi:hypothetical protein